MLLIVYFETGLVNLLKGAPVAKSRPWFCHTLGCDSRNKKVEAKTRPTCDRCNEPLRGNTAPNGGTNGR